MIRRAVPGAVLLFAVRLATNAAAQYTPEPGAVSTGAEARYYHFGQELGVKSLGQFAVPLAVVWPVGHFTFDAGAWLASTTLTRLDGYRRTVTGFTDTQVRAAYVLGSDAVVLTGLVNIPTGAQSLTAADYAVLSAAASSFLAFPVNAYGSGPSFTLGAAGAFGSGPWSFGLAASARVSGNYTPFHDADGGFTYKSGLEGRARLGVDRLVGNGKLSFGLTLSSFSDDEFATGSGAIGVYRPGRRFIGEASYTTLLGAALVTGYLWDFYRNAGDSSGVNARNKENLFALGLAGRVPVSPTLNIEPGAELRFANPAEGSAVLLELSTAVRFRVSPRITLIPVARVDFGRLVEPSPGYGHAIRGGGVSAFVRWSP